MAKARIGDSFARVPMKKIAPTVDAIATSNTGNALGNRNTLLTWSKYVDDPADEPSAGLAHTEQSNSTEQKPLEAHQG